MPDALKTNLKGPDRLRRQHAINERRKRVWHLWEKEGKTYRQIEAALKAEAKEKGLPVRGYSKSQVSKDVAATLQELGESFSHETAEWQALALQRLNKSFRAIDAKAVQVAEDGTVTVDLEAQRIALRYLREINDITGVRAAIKVDHGGTIGVNWGQIAADAKTGENTTEE